MKQNYVWNIFVIWLVLLGFSVFLAVILPSGSTWNPGTIGTGFLLGYFFLSIQIVKVGEIAALLFLGKPMGNCRPGPHFVPWLLCSLKKISSLLEQRQFPGNPEDVTEVDDDVPLPIGKVRPLRVTHVGNNTSDDPLDRSMTTKPTLVAAFQVEDATKLFTTVGSIEEAFRQLEDVMTRTALTLMANKTARWCLTNQAELNQEIRNKADALVEDWGIDLKAAYLAGIQIPKSVSESLKGIPVAQLEKTAQITRAEGERKATILNAQGTAARIRFEGIAKADIEKLLLQAKAVGTKTIADALKIDEPALVLVLDTFQTALKEADYSYVVGSGALADALNLLPLIKKAIAQKTS